MLPKSAAESVGAKRGKIPDGLHGWEICLGKEITYSPQPPDIMAECLLRWVRGGTQYAMRAIRRIQFMYRRDTEIHPENKGSGTCFPQGQDRNFEKRRVTGKRPPADIASAVASVAMACEFAAMTDHCIRPVRPDDAASIAAIYAHHVLHGTATFDTEPPEVAAWCEKIASIAARGWPFVVAEQDGSLAGYAYATQFRDRPAYAGTCENSIYLAPDHIGRGIGSRLLPALIEAAHQAGFRQMIAVIGGSEPASVALHAKCGFVHAGRMVGVGRKFDRILDTVYMQCALG
jgi:L-amino acid N-acyltransferase YncA